MRGNIKERLSDIGIYLAAFLKWSALGVITGVLCGLVGALFSRSITFVTGLREENSWLLLLLPAGGLISVAIYRLLKVSGIGTNQVFESVRSEKKVPYLLAPAVFAGSVLTHLFGGSAGREGAALQLGGSMTSLLGRIFRLSDRSRHILTICGMAALFSAVFGTPLGAAVFALEVVSVGSFCSAAIFPSFVSGLTAYFVSTYFGVVPERFNVASEIVFNFSSLWQVLIIAIAGAVVSMLFCYALHIGERLFKRVFKNEFLRIAVGGTAIILLTVIFRTTDYNGGGVEVIARIFTDGDVRYEAFLLKIVFTVITVAAGFKGGEIVPTLFIGATLGGSLATLTGMNTAFGAAVGMSALFCGVTNCPIATVILSVELFGAEGLLFYALSAVTSFLLSGNISLYEGQRLVFSKLNDEPFKSKNS